MTPRQARTSPAHGLLVLSWLIVGCASAPDSRAGAAQPVEIAPEKARLAVDVQLPEHKPALPAELNQPGNVVWGIYRVCATEKGQVSDVGILTSAAPQVDERWMEKIRSWRYQPHLVDGHAVPFCYNLLLKVAASATAP